MRGFYTIFFAILIINTSIIASADTLYRSANYINNSYTDYVPQSNIDKLAEIENTMFGKTYADQELLARIERLENIVYKRYYSSYPIDERLNNLIHNYNYSRQNRIVRTNKIKRIVDTINSTFFGVPTGYTPPISVQY